MSHLSRPIIAVALVGASCLLAAGCSSQSDPAPSGSPSRSVSASAAAPSSPAASTGTTPVAGGEDSGDDDGGTGAVIPTAIPGTGESAAPPSDGGYLSATAVVTYADWDASSKRIQTAGLVTGTGDASGTCTFTASDGSTTKTATSAANASASSVNCAQASLQVGSGTWSVVLVYAIGDDSTASESATVEVP